MRGAPKLTAADLRHWRERCPRKGCDGFLCTIALDPRFSRKQCNDCGRVAGYYSGEREVSRAEYEGAVERYEEKRRRAAASVPASMGHLAEEELAMTKAKAAKKGSKKPKAAKASKPKAAAAKKKPGEPGEPRKGTKRDLVVDMLKKNIDPEKIVAEVKKTFPDVTADVKNILRYKMYL